MTGIDGKNGIVHYKEYGLKFVGYLVLTVAYTLSGAILPAVAIWAGVFLFLTIYRPKALIYLVLTLYVTHMTFVLEDYFSGWGEFGGFWQGQLMLGFLRRVLPTSPGVEYMPRLLVMALGARIFIHYRSRSQQWRVSKTAFLYILFMAVVVFSAVGNLAFGTSMVRFVITYSIPILLYFFFTTVKFSLGERQSLFGYLMFLCLEVQVIFSFLQNFDKLLGGQLFYSDWAVGTFKYPLYGLSAYLLGIALFFYLYRFLVHRRLFDLFRLFLAFYGLLSVSVILFTIILVAFMIFSIFYSYSVKIIKQQELVLSIFALIILSLPVYYVLSDPDQENARHLTEKYEAQQKREWYEHPKIHTFTVLFEMIDENDKWVLGAGPARYLNPFAEGPIYEKYRTFNYYGTTQLSSSDFLENSIVATIGEVGLIGFFFYLALYARIFGFVRKAGDEVLRTTGKPDVVYALGTILMLFYGTVSFVYIVMVEATVTIPLMIIIGLIVQDNEDRLATLRLLNFQRQQEADTGNGEISRSQDTSLRP
ncbi:MAG: hypothetical protein AAFQ83_08550 [Bacteroidota bacterium]